MELNKDRLLTLMKANKMSYNDLAEITHVHKSTLQRYFTGKTQKIPIERLWPIAFALNTTPQYLMNETDDPNPTYHYGTENQLLDKTIILLRSLDQNQLKSVYAFTLILIGKDDS